MAAKSLIYQFDNVRVEAGEFRVFKNGEPVTLEPKAFQMLIFLLEQRGRLVTKDELLDAVWKDSFVTPNALTRIVAQLRRALGDASQNSRYIETVPTRGYRFIAEVEEIQAEIVNQEKKSLPPADSNLPRQDNDVWQEAEEDEVEQAASGKNADSENDVEIPAENAASESNEQNKVSAPRRDSVSAGFGRNKSGIFLVLSILLLATAGIVYFVFRDNADQTKTELKVSERTLAVLPFKLLNQNDETNYLSVGLADSLITKLSNVRSLTVRPTSSVMRFANEADAARAGRELKVETVIDGTVQQAGDRVRVSVQMIRAADGKSLWANTFDAQIINIFQVQDEISAKVTEALKIRLSGDERARISRPPTDNFEAYQLCLRANYHLYQFTPDGVKQAIELFNRAIALDSNYALAYAGLHNAYGISASFGNDEAAQRAEAAARKAVELDPSLGEAHAALAATLFWNKRETVKAQESFDRALELNPNSSVIHHYYSWFLIATARFDEAEKHLRRALELDPLSPGINVDQGLPLFFNRRYAEARSRYEQALKSDANSFYAHLRLGEACEGAGDFVCATGEFERAVALSNDDSMVKTQLARSLALEGKRDEAHRLLKGLTAKDAPRVSPYYLALAFSALNETDNAFDNLNLALTEQDKWIGWAKVDPRLDPLRRDIRFNDFLQRSDFK